MQLANPYPHPGAYHHHHHHQGPPNDSPYQQYYSNLFTSGHAQSTSFSTLTVGTEMAFGAPKCTSPDSGTSMGSSPQQQQQPNAATATGLLTLSSRTRLPSECGSFDDSSCTSNSPTTSTGPTAAAVPEWMKSLKGSNSKQSMSTGKTRTKDKYRIVYTDTQRLQLEVEFAATRYITIKRKSELAQELGLSDRQIKIWFQNRRAKDRKHQRKVEQSVRCESSHPAATTTGAMLSASATIPGVATVKAEGGSASISSCSSLALSAAASVSTANAMDYFSTSSTATSHHQFAPMGPSLTAHQSLPHPSAMCTAEYQNLLGIGNISSTSAAAAMPEMSSH